jgi:multiple sugar transport system permease protein
MPRVSRREKAVRLALAGVAIFWSAFPIYLVIASSFKDPRTIFEVPPRFIFTPTLDNYRSLWRLWPEFFDNLLNSIIITLGATLVTVFASSLAGYVYSRYRSRLLTASAFFMLFVRMLPPIIVTLPLFPIVNYLSLNDTHILLVFLYATFFVSLSTWIMKAFIDAIPRELEEAARIDGANLWMIIVAVVLPLAIHGIIASSIFVFVYSWNEFIFALIFTTHNAKTAPLVLSEILGTVEGVDWGILFAAATVQLVPIVVFVIAVQKYVIAGLTSGGVKA